ncbi:MAG: tetratricopeptide repeat protein, partial [Burkholderiales bacterium]
APAGNRAGRRAALAVALVLPLVAVLGYLQFGDIKALDPMVRQEGHPVTPKQIAEMVDKLAARLKQNPDDATGWTMLGRSYAVLGRYQESADAYARAAALVGDDANLLADYADTLAMARGGNLVGEPMQIVQRGLKVDPKNVKLLALAGSAEFAQRNYAEAVRYWERGLAEIPPGSDFRRAVESSIEEARKAGNLPAAPETKTEVAAHSKAVTGTVTLAPALASQVEAGDTLFVFARPAKGARMPVAILRLAASQLPYAFRLDDSQAMAAGNTLSSQAEVVVGARISKSGNALPQPGDLEGASAPVAPGTSGLQIAIDRVVR